MITWLYANSYNVLLGLGGIAVIILMIMRRSQYRLAIWQAGVLGLSLLLCAVAGAKLLYIIESGGETAGMSLFGAVYLVLLCMPLIGRIFSLKGAQALDACAPCGALIIGVVRFGCYLSGCCGGKFANLGSWVFQWPTQIMESFCDFLILALLLQMEKKKHRPGSLYAWFLILYCLIRFMIEFLRNTPKDWIFLSHGQWFAMIGFTMGLVVLICTHFHKEERYEKHKKDKP